MTAEGAPPNAFFVGWDIAISRLQFSYLGMALAMPNITGKGTTFSRANSRQLRVRLEPLRESGPLKRALASATKRRDICSPRRKHWQNSS
jgi:hypothetical protein